MIDQSNKNQSISDKSGSSDSRNSSLLTKIQQTKSQQRSISIEEYVRKRNMNLSSYKSKSFMKIQKKKIGLEDFEYLGTLGRGSYGEVVLVKKKSNQKEYAMKVIDKCFLFKEKKQYQVYIEREIYMRLKSTFLAKLYYSFQDKYKLYFVIEHVQNGSFSQFLALHQKKGKLDLKTIKFYSAEIILIIEFLHKNGIAHRDLKVYFYKVTAIQPENLMVTATNHLKVIDFGTASFFNTNLMNKELIQIINKIKAAERGVLGKDNKLKDINSFVGTAEYLSPELIQNKQSSSPADLFALGCIIYKMFTGVTPFYDKNEYSIFQRIEKGMYSLPNYIPMDAKDLIKRLLQRDPTKRLGAGSEGSPYDLNALKQHKFFDGVDFDNLIASEAPQCELDIHLKTDYSFSETEAEFKSDCKIHEHEHKELDNIDDLEDYQEEESCEDEEGESEESSEEEDDEEEKFILTGLAEKKCGWLFYKERLLMLSADHPRLIYYDNQTGQFKALLLLIRQLDSQFLFFFNLGGNIIMQQNLCLFKQQLEYQIEVNLKDKTKWEIITPYRKYIFREMEGEPAAAIWVEAINDVLKNLKKK